MKRVFRGYLRSFGVVAVLTLFMFVLFPMVTSGAAWISIPMSILLPVVFLMLSFMDSASRGEQDAAYTEMQKKRMEEGHAPDAKDREREYWAPRGFIVGAAALLTLFLLVLAVVALISSLTRQSAIDAGLRHEASVVGLAVLDVVLPGPVHGFMPALEQVMGFAYPLPSAINPLDLASRITLFAYSGLFTTLERLGILRLFYPLFAALYPIAQGIGYMQGPRRRAAVHAAIEKGKRRARRRQRREIKKRMGDASATQKGRK